MIIGATHVLYGHDQPGDGFTAGVIISLGLSIRYVVFGYKETRNRLKYLAPSTFIGIGIVLIIISGSIGAFINGEFLSNVDVGRILKLPLPKGVHLSTSFLFETAICISVVGSVTHMLNTLGRPDDKEEECRCRLEEIEALEKMEK